VVEQEWELEERDQKVELSGRGNHVVLSVLFVDEVNVSFLLVQVPVTTIFENKFGTYSNSLYSRQSVLQSDP